VCLHFTHTWVNSVQYLTAYTVNHKRLQPLLGRPERSVPDGLMFYRICYLLCFFRHAFSEFPRPIALKPCHMVAIWLNFIIPLQKFGGGGAPPQKNLGDKNMQNFGQFWTTSDLIANISGTTEDIQNRTELQTMAIPPAFIEKSPVNFGPLTAWNSM